MVVPTGWRVDPPPPAFHPLHPDPSLAICQLEFGKVASDAKIRTAWPSEAIAGPAVHEVTGAVGSPAQESHCVKLVGLMREYITAPDAFRRAVIHTRASGAW